MKKIKPKYILIGVLSVIAVAAIVITIVLMNTNKVVDNSKASVFVEPSNPNIGLNDKEYDGITYMQPDKSLVMPASANTCKNAFSDKFNGSLDSRWKFIDPKNDSSVVLNQIRGTLQLFTTKGHDLYPTNNMNAPRFLQAIDGDFRIDTAVIADTLQDYQGAGLLVWQDSANFLRLEKSFMGTFDVPGGKASKAIPGIRVDQNVNNKYKAVYPVENNPTTERYVDLRIDRKGNLFTTYWKPHTLSDGKTATTEKDWKQVGAQFTQNLSSKLWVGFDVIVETNPSFEASFNYFRVSCPTGNIKY